MVSAAAAVLAFLVSCTAAVVGCRRWRRNWRQELLQKSGPFPVSTRCSDSLAGFSPAFGQLVPPQQRQAVTGLLQRVAALRAEAAPPAQQTVSVAAVAAQALSHLRSLSVSRDGGSSGAGSGASSDSEEQALLTPQTAAAVATLRELCALPDASDAWLAHVLSSRGGGDVEVGAGMEVPGGAHAEKGAAAECLRAARFEVSTLLLSVPAANLSCAPCAFAAAPALLSCCPAGRHLAPLLCRAPQAAAAWMLECPDLAAAQAAWQAEAQARRAERERSKKAIVSRFQLQAVPDGGSAPPGKGRPPPLQAWGQAAGGGGGRGGEGSKVRYRDGMVATRAGQKYVVGKASFWVWAAHVAVGHSASSIGQPSLDLPAPACASRGFPPLSVPACLRTPPNPEPPCLPRSAGRGLGRRQPRQSVHQGQAR